MKVCSRRKWPPSMMQYLINKYFYKKPVPWFSGIAYLRVLLGIVDHMSGNVAHLAVPSGKLWFLRKSRSNPLCMSEGVGGRYGLAWTNVDFQELVVNGKLLGEDDPC